MPTVLNILMVGLVLLIAYWWANQGLFSAILHLLCVIVAGAVALGVWEPLVVGVLLRGSWFDYYAWGVALVGVFAVTLFLLRLATDRLAPANVDVPRWANLVVGFPVGAAAGVITLGILVIGAGHVQSHAGIMQYYGRGRSGDVVRFSKGMWLPAPFWTNEFYSWLSVTSMWTNKPMRQYQPLMHHQAALLRDSYDGGKGQITFSPDSVDVTSFQLDPTMGVAAVGLNFRASAMDFGEQLTLSNAQVRLIGDARGKQAAGVEYPDQWVQNGLVYEFDDASHYMVSTPGQENARAVFVFKLDDNDFTPRFVQVKGLRYPLPPATEWAGTASAGGGGDTAPTIDRSARPIPADDLLISNRIKPVNVGTNELRGMIEEIDKYLVEGFGTFDSSGGRPPRALAIQGVYEPPGARVLMLDVSRNRAADLFSRALRDRTDAGAALGLVDSNGNRYSPIGYIHEKGGGKVDIKLAPGKFLRTLEELPNLPTSGTQRLRLYFRVTEGVSIVAFMLGDETVGTCDLEVTPDF